MPDLLTLPVRVRYGLGNGWRRLSSPWLQRDANPAECRSLFAASFGDEGWHHIRATLKEVDVNPSITYEQTALYRFLTGFRPISISEFVDHSQELSLPLFVYPWGTFRTGEAATSKDPVTSRFCGPSSEQFVADEFDRIVRLYAQLRVTGYRPYTFPHSFISGTWLERLDGRRVFVVLQGNHRLAVLAHLGHQQIAVRPLRGWLWRIREADVRSWLLVRSGRCSVAHALSIFALFFNCDGHHLRNMVERRS